MDTWTSLQQATMDAMVTIMQRLSERIEGIDKALAAQQKANAEFAERLDLIDRVLMARGISLASFEDAEDRALADEAECRADDEWEARTRVRGDDRGAE